MGEPIIAMTPGDYFLRWIVVGVVALAPIYVMLWLIYRKLP